MSSERLIDLCYRAPGAALHYLQNKYESMTLVKVDILESEFNQKAADDAKQKKLHL